MNKAKSVGKLVDIIEELDEYNKLTRWMKFLNWFRIRLKMKPIENLVINPERARVLKRRAARVTKKIYAKTDN